ncbi:unnamed protein product [Ixodes persulcatus]
MAKALRSLVWEGGVREIRMLQCLAPENHCPPLSVRDAWLLVYNPLSQPYRAPLRLAVHPGYEFNVDGSPTQVSVSPSAKLPVWSPFWFMDWTSRFLVSRSKCPVRTPAKQAHTISPTRNAAFPYDILISRTVPRDAYIGEERFQHEDALWRTLGAARSERPFRSFEDLNGPKWRFAAATETNQPINDLVRNSMRRRLRNVDAGKKIARLNEDIQLRFIDEIYETSEDAVLVVLFAWRECPTFQRSDVTRSMIRPGGLVFGSREEQYLFRVIGTGVCSTQPLCHHQYPGRQQRVTVQGLKSGGSQGSRDHNGGRGKHIGRTAVPGTTYLDHAREQVSRCWSPTQESLRSLANRMVWSPQLSLVDTEQKHFVNLSVKSWSGLRTPLPRYLHVLSLERVSGDRVLLRFEYQAPETSNYTHPVNLFISRLLTKQVLYHVTETSLGSTQDRDSVLRFIWRRRGAVAPVAQQQRMRVWLKRGSRSRFEDTVRILPGHIRTFVARIEKRRGLHA